jgi:hypothetical protein
MRCAHADRFRIANWSNEITLRLARPGDAAALTALAQLDERPLPPPQQLLLLVDSEPVAGMSLATGEVVADPFRRTIELQALLRLHAGSARVAELPARRSAVLTPLRAGVTLCKS